MPVSSDVIPFQSTLPREERHLLPVFCRPEYLYFNPRSHERSDRVQYLTSQAHQFISIHAPTRGATLAWLYAWNLPSISIHAPTRGATDIKNFIAKINYHFNPRSHERSDINSLIDYLPVHEFQSTLPREERRFMCPYQIFR